MSRGAGSPEAGGRHAAERGEPGWGDAARRSKAAQGPTGMFSRGAPDRLRPAASDHANGAARSSRPRRKFTTTRRFSSVPSKRVEWFEPRIT